MNKVLITLFALSITTASYAGQTSHKTTSGGLKPSASTAKKCFNFDEEHCNKIYDQCEKSNSQGCKEFKKTWQKLIKQENLG